MAMPNAVPILLTPDERTRLERWARGGRTARRRRRARIILQAAEGASNAAIARALRTDRACVARWRARFFAHRLAGIRHDAPRSGRPPTISTADLQAIVTHSTSTTPAGQLPWSARTLAKRVGVSPKTVHRVWQAHGLSPHRMRLLRLRHVGREFRGLAYVVGRFLTPLDSALVLGGDADRWRPGPLHAAPSARTRGRKGAPEAGWRRTGVPARYGELEMPTGHVIGVAPELSRHRDWLRFLEKVADRMSARLDLHIVADNGAIHQHPEVQRWVERHPAVHLHLVGVEQLLPARLVQLLRRVSAIHGQSPPRKRKACGTLRDFVEAFSPPLTADRLVVTWVASAEMMRVFCGGFDPAD
jgi:transposase